MLATASVVASVVARDVSVHTANTITTEQSHLMMHVLVGGNMSVYSKFSRECDSACGQYRSYLFQYFLLLSLLPF